MSLDANWLEAIQTATANRESTGLHGTAELLIGKTSVLTIAVEDGRVIGEASGTAQCQMPFTKVQAESLTAGEMVLAVDYMRGDFKPTGSTAAILALIDALDAASESN